MLTTTCPSSVWIDLRDLRWGEADASPGIDILQPDPAGVNRRIALLTRHLDPYTAQERKAIQDEHDETSQGRERIRVGTTAV